MTMTAHPALVLNADFRPMSYFPLSLLSWQDAVHAVFSERVSVVAEYDTWARSPSTQIRLPSVVALRKYQRRRASRGVHALQRVPARPLHLPVLRRGVCVFGADVRARHPALARRPDDVVEHRHGLRAVQHEEGNSTRIKPRRLPKEPTLSELLAAKRAFPPGYLHESWTDYLYWDAQLEA